ncbi:MAG: S46 family peptidase [Bacteroidia bacterium]|nr:S46 family peptidase [Bacteroidia bacterium]MCF8425270.1 S46 family peptidase [Bacteroidia bacterium]MCF8446508.1 S46 family peptidase [Bacteroidia bacterium]
MKKIYFTFVLLASTLLFSSHKADEGMFPMSEMKNIDLKKAGLRMDPVALYNPNGISLVDAIVRVGGCTGSFVSNDGLIVTNHHCAFGFVAAMSTVQNNYIKEGFLANTHEQEAQAKGLVCKITASYEDVSDKILMGTQSTNDPLQRLQIIAANTKKVTDEENKKNPSLQCEVSEMFTGKNYVLFRYQLLKDVRVVYVPARSIGEYGGEKDNWVWPRHSGDFAFLRAYVAPDGSAAEYAPENVPFKPKKFLKINVNGIKENDFVFVLGYPGRTYRNQPASYYKYHEDYFLKYVSDLFDWEINKMEQMGEGNDSLQIKYAGKIKSLANTTKNFKGKLQGFRRVGLTEKKFAEEKQLQEFLLSEPNLKKEFGEVIPSINKLYDEIIDNAPKNLFFDFVYSVAPTLQMAAAVDNYKASYLSLKSKTEKQDFLRVQVPKLKTTFQRLYGQMDPVFEKAAILKVMEDAHAYNKKNKISAVEDFYAKYKTEEARSLYIDQIYSKTKLNNREYMLKILADSSADFSKIQDGLTKLANSINWEMNAADNIDNQRNGTLNALLGRYADAKSAFQKKQFIPDANGTLRFTYGYVRGYYPNDAEYNKPFTTLRGVIEKEDGKEYELMQIVKDLYAAKDYGIFMNPDLNELPVDFLYNLDTTGGNSGSPVMDADGSLVGVNFDRAYTATINDYAWNEAYSRSVGVDIRYVLWTVQKVAKADFLLKELNVNPN